MGKSKDDKKNEKQMVSATVDNTHRKVWDKDEFSAKAAEREKQEQEAEESAYDAKKRRRIERDPLHQGLIVERAKLQGRGFQVDLASRLGKTQVVTTSTPLNQQAGYYCSVCECVLRDSQSYLDHINGKYHNRALGMNMVVERSTADQVRKKFEALKKSKEAVQPDLDVADGFDRRVLERQEEEERERDERLKDKKSRRRALKDDVSDDGEEQVDPSMAMMMGFGGFGGSKK